ncbi:acyl carrier protein [Aliiroseovarius sp. S2029]|uniref:acyl carrier protein n=1 Tax=Aliiroseovarius sp. S2029 TaxID=2936988 RepID=UPI0020BF7FCF|nr:acyl carrier protein [Aliiroseovarius sp. S2029]MCK8483933.1 acyl carrier protein [Aliiroseovarius sp. S2029]
MTESDIQTALADELHKIAPDVTLDEIDKSADLLEEFDIDSMDFLRLVTALGKRFDLPMPEADYPQMASFDAMARYLSRKTD